MGCNCGKARKYVAIDPLTGACLVEDATGCRQFMTPQGAINAAKAAGHDQPGVRRI